eukprot:798761-Pyramimonas_sp.AAC.1
MIVKSFQKKQQINKSSSCAFSNDRRDQACLFSLRGAECALAVFGAGGLVKKQSNVPVPMTARARSTTRTRTKRSDTIDEASFLFFAHLRDELAGVAEERVRLLLRHRPREGVGDAQRAPERARRRGLRAGVVQKRLQGAAPLQVRPVPGAPLVEGGHRRGQRQGPLQLALLLRAAQAEAKHNRRAVHLYKTAEPGDRSGETQTVPGVLSLSTSIPRPRQVVTGGAAATPPPCG